MAETIFENCKKKKNFCNPMQTKFSFFKKKTKNSVSNKVALTKSKSRYKKKKIQKLTQRILAQVIFNY